MMTEQNPENPAQALERVAAGLGLTMAATFVPLSQSRNAAPREDGRVWRSLNWRVALSRNGKPCEGLESIDYAQGEAHAPAYKASAAAFRHAGYTERRARNDSIAFECETGRRATWTFGDLRGGKPIAPPPLAEILWSLALDSSVLDHATFESWASEYGYSTDSRTAEATYRACLAQALALRAAIGEAGIEALREAGQDY